MKTRQAILEFNSWPTSMREKVIEWMNGSLCGHASKIDLPEKEKEMFQAWWNKYWVNAK